VIRVAGLHGSPAPSNLFTGETGVRGVAIDPATDRIYWATKVNDVTTIRVAGLHGSPTPSTLYATEVNPFAVAVDSGADRIYWATNDTAAGAIRLAGLSGSPTPLNLFAAQSNPRYVALLRSPAPAGAPAVSGGGQVGQALLCGQGAWAADVPGAQLYRAPRAFSYQWLLDGAEVGGAAGSSYTPAAAGSYACRVTASNHAGATSQTSGSVSVTSRPANQATGQREAALKKCKKKKRARARAKCKKRAKKLPV
jgi:hypothetical protein